MILLNKTDLVSDADLREIEARIRAINPYARLHRTERCSIPIAEVLNRNAFDLDRILDIEPQFLDARRPRSPPRSWAWRPRSRTTTHGGLTHYHDEDMQSLSLSTDKAIDPDKFFPWIQNLVAQEGGKILRSKGILAFKDDPQRFVFQGVHMMLDGDHQRDWKDAEKRESRLVFIGRELPESMIRKGFAECVA